jgi:hypothetical protein
MNWRVGLYCLLGGLWLTTSALGAGHFWWWWLSGVMLAASCVPVARFGPRSVLAQLGVLAPALVVVGIWCTMSEAYLFFPPSRGHAVADTIGGSVTFFIVAVTLAVLAKFLRLTETAPAIVEHRSVGMAVPMILLSGICYVIYYLIFGGITYQFFTRQYYPHAQEAAMQLGLWFWGIELARGVLMTLAVLPVIYTLRLPRWQAALAVGALVWVVGGAAPLVVPNSAMVTVQRYIHIVEIFTQNFPLGVTAVLLLRPREEQRVVKMQTATSA